MSPEIAFATADGINSWGEFASCADFFPRGKKNFEPWSASDARGGLAAEFELFEPLNGFALVGDDLCLPD